MFRHFHKKVDSASLPSVVAGQTEPDDRKLGFLIDTAHELNVEVPLCIIQLIDAEGVDPKKT